MRVAIVHYHLQPGGVTRIIQHGLTTLSDKQVKVVVLTGKKPVSGFGDCWKVVEGLQYEQERPSVTAQELAAQMVAAARDALGGIPDVWHVHNHSLGKNTILPDALVLLAHQGYPLLLQTHDFAEDGRPANYRLMLKTMAGGKVTHLASHLYPRGSHVHYALLNKRDYGFLSDAGAETSCLHLLPNPVDLPLEQCETETLSPRDEYLWVYPTRGIRRKNIGEFLLWAAAAPAHHTFATTLGPDNPLERPRYERWKAFAHELRLPIEFEISAKPGVNFVSQLKQADALVSTSVAEGFGLAFLEPWLAGRPVTGRILEEITHEFCQLGFKLPWGYSRVDIPLQWFGKEQLIEAARKGLQHSMAAYGRTPDPEDLDRLLTAWIVNGMVDFGRLDEPFQEKAIRRVVAGSGSEFLTCTPPRLPQPENTDRIIADNCQILKQCFCLKRYGKSLFELYNTVAASPVSPIESLDGEKLLDHFLAPERLHLLRVD